MHDTDQLYTAAQAARVLALARSTFFRLLAERQLPAADVLLPGLSPARAKRWSASALGRYVDSRRTDRVKLHLLA